MGASSAIPLTAIFLDQGVMIILMAVLSGVAVIVESARLKLPAVNRLLVFWLKPLLKETEGRRPTGATYIAIAALAAFLLFDKPVAITALFFLSLGDPLAAIVGGRVRGIRVRGKSPVGTLTFFIVAVTVGAALSAGGQVSFQWALVAGAAVAALVELAPIWVDDNLTIPLISGGAMTWMGV